MILDSVAFSVSEHCNIRCAHCCVGSGPERPRRALTAERMKGLLDALSGVVRLRRVAFTGGEPTLFPREVLPAVEYASELGVETVVVSNATWASTEKAAGRTAEKYAKAGLARFELSYTPYHRNFVSWESYVRATRACLEHGIAVGFLVSFPDFSRARAQKERLRRLLLGALGSRARAVEFSAGVIVPAGRAASTLGEGAASEVAEGACGMVANPLLFTSSGDVYACCGFAYPTSSELRVGTLDDVERDPAGFLRRVRRNVLLRWIRSVGPWKILETLDPERYPAEARGSRGHVCAGCQLLFHDPENRRRLATYLEAKGEAILFDECFAAFRATGEVG